MKEKDLIISGGFNIYPKEIEAVLDELPDVRERYYWGLSCRFGEAVVAVVVKKEQASLTEEDIIDMFRANL